MSAFTPLETAHLRIRPFAVDDWQAVHAYTGDAAVMQFVDGRPMTEAQTRQFIVENMGDEAKHFAIELREGNHLVGHLAFHLWFGPRTYEFGWVLHPRYHGQGYATEASAAMLRYGFESLRLHRVIATCQPENAASWRVMEKLGMQREAHFRKAHLLDGETWWDEYFYAVLEEEWFAKENEENR
jgi:ribosomal-protein-alanine N-acetyltransferase